MHADRAFLAGPPGAGQPHCPKRAAEEGVAVVFSTSDVSEVLTSCTRVLVLSRGRIAAEFTPEQATREKVLAAADDSHETLNIPTGGEQ